MTATIYTSSELAVLYHLKRYGPLTSTSKSPQDSLLTKLRRELGMKKGQLTWALNKLENRCVILRTYARPIKQNFADNQGYNPVVRLELIDPEMELPPPPKPMPLAVVVAKENEAMYENGATEPTADDIVEALLHRISELQGQVDKLAAIVQDQATKLDKAGRSSTHLTERIRAALTQEQWDSLHHKGQR